jgi:predicted metal-dependent hydrolase
MAIMEPGRIPEGRDHLDEDERSQLIRLELLVAAGRFEEAQELAEDLWTEATDAHKRLYQGISNALTAVCARHARKIRGAKQIAAQTRSMLEPYPRRVLGLDLDALLESVHHYVTRGEGPVLLRREGGGSRKSKVES